MPRGYSGGSGGGSVSVSGVNWSAVAAALRDVPKEIRTEFNRRTREIGKPIMSAMREAVQGTSASVSSSGGSQYRRLAWSAGHRSSGPMTFRAARRFSGLSAGGGGGLRASVGRTLQLTRRASGELIGIRIDSNSGRMPPGERSLPGYMDEGTWRHPVMGNRHAWVTQTVSPTGWFTTTARQSLPKVRPEAEAAIQEALDKIGAHIDAAG